METLDGATFGQNALRLGLLNEPQLREALEETGARNPDLQLLIGILERKGYLTPWQTDKIKKGDTDGFLLGGYRLLYRIASGSFGRVYRADDPRTGRVVAVKVLRRRWSEDQAKIDLFIREGKLGLSLKHPNIVEVLAISQDAASKQYFIAMEFVEGDNLRNLLQIRKRLKVPEALQIMEDAAAGLNYAYSKGVTHRDIKHTNLLIHPHGHAKLVDFGLAQLFAAVGATAKDFSKDDKVDRTVDYAGLERATNVKTGDARSDIYFLGCILYETLTGRSPLAMTRNKTMRMMKNRFEEVTPISRDEVSAPPAVFQLVETMMELSPQKRYQTPAQLLDAVRAAKREVAGTAGSPRTGPRTVFIVERDERLQDGLRDKFKKFGYRVLISSDPVRALDRFKQQPFDALVVDAGTTAIEGRIIYERIMSEAGRQGSNLSGVLILSEEQADWVEKVPHFQRGSVLVRPVTFAKLVEKLDVDAAVTKVEG